MKWEHKTTIYHHTVNASDRIEEMEKDGWLFCGMAGHNDLMVFARPVVKTRFEREGLMTLAATADQQANEVRAEIEDCEFVAKTLRDCAQALLAQIGEEDDAE